LDLVERLREALRHLAQHTQHNAEPCYAECHIEAIYAECCVVIPNVIMYRGDMRNVVEYTISTNFTLPSCKCAFN